MRTSILSAVILLLGFGSNQKALAQKVNKSLEVGNTITIGKCPQKSGEFKFIDEYARTLPLDSGRVNFATGEGLLEHFFEDKSIDAHRLPCLHQGRKYKIAALHEFEVEGKTQRVLLLNSGYPLTLFWVLLDEALEAEEIIP